MNLYAYEVFFSFEFESCKPLCEIIDLLLSSYYSTNELDISMTGTMSPFK